jgi:hypothetical protein
MEEIGLLQVRSAQLRGDLFQLDQEIFSAPGRRAAIVALAETGGD